MTPYAEALHAHIHRFFAGHLSEILQISVGCGTVEPEDGRRIELVLCAGDRSPRHAVLVEVTAFYHLNGNTLDVGHTCPMGEPWVPGSPLDCMLVSLPYPFGRDLEEFTAGEYHAHLLWLVPIAQSEARLIHDAGLEAVEAKFESSGMDYSDPQRAVISLEKPAWWKRW